MPDLMPDLCTSAMQLAKFTSGPWEVDIKDDVGQRRVRGPHFQICTCWHHCVGSIEKEMEANALLIAAAPDLFEACAEFVRKVDCGMARSTKSYNQMKAALAKATGAEGK